MTLESINAPFIPAESYYAMPAKLGNFVCAVRDPESSRKLLIENNLFVEGALPGFITRPLAPEAHNVHKVTFPTEKTLIQVNQWPNEMPIGGEPVETTQIVSDCGALLEELERVESVNGST